ncbi:MAG: alpha/beta fold hydrolase, partial [Promethearchaeota archaeon]
MPFVEIRGTQVYYQEQGNGLPLIFIHGSMSSHLVWSYQRPLSEEYRTVMLDLPGHGRSDPPDAEISVKLYAEYIAEFIKKRDLIQGIPVGHSLGGAITLQLALDNPGLLTALVLVGTGAKLGVLPAILEAIRTNYEESVELTVGQLAFAAGADPVLVEQSKQECLRCSPEIAYADFVACNNFDVRDRLADIYLQTLIIVGKEDKLTPLKWSQYLREKIPKSKLLEVEQAGHMVMLEKPDMVNGRIRSFIRMLR